MISEQTGAAASTKVPGRRTLTQELDEQQDVEAAQPTTPARTSVFDAPYAADVARDADVTPQPDVDEDTTPRRD